ncbi:TIR domain-containing protein [Zobellia alginiliquefaciens]|uniref:TIR domain-containing protein n=1 Tax=Zobellia alginiliquefaciens TaxID=3032586 RepID=UPI0023E384DD|nr:TIR domain-containing protein [Zobellia alginiliquefaciens]
MSSTNNIFAIYSSQDKDVLQYLLPHLQPLAKDFNIAIWSDDAIDGEQPLNPQYSSQLERADVFLFLLSNAFMNSEFIKYDEFKNVIDRYKEGGATVIPILLESCPWDIEFTSDDYNFNFKELQVFRRDEKLVGGWNPTDKVCMQVGFYVRGLLASYSKKIALEESENKGEKKELNKKKEEQIVMNFFGESEVDTKADIEKKQKEEAELKRREEKNKKLREEAEAKELIRREKRQRQKAENQIRIEKEVQARRVVVQDESREREFIKARIAIGEKRHEQVTQPLRDAAWEKVLGETVTTQRIPNRKNGLAKYNYRFSNKNTIEARTIVPESKRAKEEPIIQIVVEEKSSAKIAIPQRETQREKISNETVPVDQTVTRKTNLARHNYQFDRKREVEASEVIQEERSVKEEPKTQIVLKEGRWTVLLKNLREAQWDKKLYERVAVLKTITKKNFTRINYLFGKKVVAEAKSLVQEERQVDKETKIQVPVEEKKPSELVQELKKVLKRTGLALREYQEQSAEGIKHFLKAAKSKVAGKKVEKGRIVEVLNSVTNKTRTTLQKYKVKSATGFSQFFREAKNYIYASKIGSVRAGLLTVALVIFGILIYVIQGDSEKQPITLSEIEEVPVDSELDLNSDSDFTAEVITEKKPENQAAAILKLGIGDTYNGGIIFAFDPLNKTGKIAYMEDKGPMAWKDAMSIHEQLGEGWRLPEIDELRLLYKTIGQGADNEGKFVAELYWSATPFDKHQARLVKFSDGNASYHYNSSGTHRKFRVRAIKDLQL